MTLLTALDGHLGDPMITVDGVSLPMSDLCDRADRVAAALHGARAVAVPGAPSMDTVLGVVAAIRAGKQLSDSKGASAAISTSQRKMPLGRSRRR